MSTKDYGKVGEEYAVRLLKRAGYKIIERNFRSKFGEIDILAIDGETFVFVEVKSRWTGKFGKPEEAVTSKKLRKIKKAGEYYCLTHSGVPKKLRIDVVSIEVNKGKVKSAKIIKVL